MYDVNDMFIVCGIARSIAFFWYGNNGFWASFADPVIQKSSFLHELDRKYVDSEFVVVFALGGLGYCE